VAYKTPSWCDDGIHIITILAWERTVGGCTIRESNCKL